MTTVKDETLLRAIEGQATRWFIRNREGELTAQEREDFMLWLRLSPQHVNSYLTMVDLSGKMKAGVRGLELDGDALYRQARAAISQSATVVSFRASTDDVHGVAAIGRGFGTRRRWVIVSAAAAVLMSVLTAVYVHYMDWQTIVVPHGEQRMLRLNDGSTAHVNSDARLKINYSQNQRVIELKEGQALFDVFHDAKRPFIVRAGSADVVAVGTKFEVFRRPEATTVTVVEGKVKVMDRDSAQIASEAIAGQRVELNKKSISKPTKVNTELATAWTRREITFSGQPLSEVVAEFNRYTEVPIVIEDPAIRDYRIRGVFLTYDLDSFVAYLQDFDSLQVERTADAIRVKPAKK